MPPWIEKTTGNAERAATTKPISLGLRPTNTEKSGIIMPIISHWPPENSPSEYVAYSPEVLVCEICFFSINLKFFWWFAKTSFRRINLLWQHLFSQYKKMPRLIHTVRIQTSEISAVQNHFLEWQCCLWFWTVITRSIWFWNIDQHYFLVSMTWERKSAHSFSRVMVSWAWINMPLDYCVS